MTEAQLNQHFPGLSVMDFKVLCNIAYHGEVPSSYMKWTGAGGHSSWTGFRSEQAIKICDSRWQWRNGECVNIDKENSEENDDICKH